MTRTYVPKVSYCARHDTHPALGEPCWSCANPIIERALAASQERVRELEAAIDLLPCLDRAMKDGKGVVPVPEWVVADIAAALRVPSTVGAEGEQGLDREGGVQDRPTE